MPPPVPTHTVAQFCENGKSQEVRIVAEEKKMGRPYSNGAEKTTTKRARMTEEDIMKLKLCSEKLKRTESEVIRLGIEKIYLELKKDIKE